MDQLGQYRYVAKQATRSVAGTDFRIACYGAYRANGLIGTERNGIVVLNESQHCVVLDDHAPQTMGWTDEGRPSPKLVQEFDRLLSMGEVEFLDFVQSHPHFRGPHAVLAVDILAKVVADAPPVLRPVLGAAFEAGHFEVKVDRKVDAEGKLHLIVSVGVFGDATMLPPDALAEFLGPDAPPPGGMN